jgi:hypothetical protein
MDLMANSTRIAEAMYPCSRQKQAGDTSPRLHFANSNLAQIYFPCYKIYIRNFDFYSYPTNPLQVESKLLPPLTGSRGTQLPPIIT